MNTEPARISFMESTDDGRFEMVFVDVKTGRRTRSGEFYRFAKPDEKADMSVLDPADFTPVGLVRIQS